VIAPHIVNRKTRCARGGTAGEFPLARVIQNTCTMNTPTLHRLTDPKSQAAIHLVEKLNFDDDPAIMAVQAEHPPAATW
jgi:hypothetical protein